MNLKRLESLVGITLALGLVGGAWLQIIPYSLTETLGFVTGAACVYLVVKKSIWNFPIGIANNLFFIVLFAGARLYGDAALQLVYIALGVQGWYLWRHGGEKRGALNITRAPIKLLAVLLFTTVMATIGLTFILRAARGSLPVLDALTTVLSLAAQVSAQQKARRELVRLDNRRRTLYLRLREQGIDVDRNPVCGLSCALRSGCTKLVARASRSTGGSIARESGKCATSPGDMTRRGLIVGKFYPPHKGHSFLINQASSQADELHIILCRRTGDSPAGDLRASWLREMHPTARVLVVDDDNFDPDDSNFWAKQSVSWLGFTPDVVFTSEDYGERFAASLGCEHAIVDRARGVFPVSGTLVRENPFACWNYLEPIVRGYYAKRVCIVGAESTGKSTLAQQLAQQFNTVWVPEYGRQIAEEKLSRDGKYYWSSEEFIEIAQNQCDNEDGAAKQANQLLVCDTDAFATTIWHQRYLGRRSSEVDQIAESHRRPDIYFLTDVNTPFIQDGTRDGQSIREWMHNTFISELSATNRDYILLSGSYQERFDAAVKYIENHFHITSLAR